MENIENQLLIIFLDIDGVLNHQKWYNHRMDILDQFEGQYPKGEFCPETIELLNKLIENTGAKVVVSSTWRLGRTIEELQNILNSVGFKGEVIGTTPHFGSITLKGQASGYTIPRGCEIDWWLHQNDFQRINWSREKQIEYLQKSKVKNYIILDDDSDMLYNQREHYVKCNAYGDGFNQECYEKALKILNSSILELYYNKFDT